MGTFERVRSNVKGVYFLKKVTKMKSLLIFALLFCSSVTLTANTVDGKDILKAEVVGEKRIANVLDELLIKRETRGLDKNKEKKSKLKSRDKDRKKKTSNSKSKKNKNEKKRGNRKQ